MYIVKQLRRYKELKEGDNLERNIRRKKPIQKKQKKKREEKEEEEEILWWYINCSTIKAQETRLFRRCQDQIQAIHQIQED